jgi:hypothetical protein
MFDNLLSKALDVCFIQVVVLAHVINLLFILFIISDNI